MQVFFEEEAIVVDNLCNGKMEQVLTKHHALRLSDHHFESSRVKNFE